MLGVRSSKSYYKRGRSSKRLVHVKSQLDLRRKKMRHMGFHVLIKSTSKEMWFKGYLNLRHQMKMFMTHVAMENKLNAT